MQQLSEMELLEIYEQYFEKGDELILKQFPSKQKKQHGVLLFIIKVVDPEVIYSEKALNEILKPIYSDFVMIRRYLVDLGLLKRKDDGSAYWVNR